MEGHYLALPTGHQEGLALLLPPLFHQSSQCPCQALAAVRFLHSAPWMMAFLLKELLLKQHLRTFSYTGKLAPSFSSSLERGFGQTSGDVIYAKYAFRSSQLSFI